MEEMEGVIKDGRRKRLIEQKNNRGLSPPSQLLRDVLYTIEPYDTFVIIHILIKGKWSRAVGRLLTGFK